MTCAQIGWPDNQAYFKEFVRRAKAARVPLAGSLELTRLCNLRCPHCYLGPQERVRDGSLREMSTAQVLSVIDQAAAAGCLRLLITGGEPLGRSDFPDVYRHAKLVGLEVSVFTNGTMVTDGVTALFQDLPPRVVEVTLYGATAETYERVTGVPGSFTRCLDGIGRLRDGGVRLGFKTMLMAWNSHELEAIEELAASYGGKFRFDPLLNARLDGGREPLGFRLDTGEVVRAEFANPRRRKEWADFHARNPAVAPSYRLFQCGAGETMFHVDAYGSLQPCLMIPGFSYSLATETFSDGWARMARLREAEVGGGNVCSSCQRRPYCGYCPGMVALENGDPEIPSAYLCALGERRMRALASLSQE